MSLSALSHDGRRPLFPPCVISVRDALKKTKAPAPLSSHPAQRRSSGKVAGNPDPAYVPWEEAPFDGLDDDDVCLRLRHQDVSFSRKVEGLEELSLRGGDAHRPLLPDLVDRMSDELPLSEDPETPRSVWLSLLLNETVRIPILDAAERERLAGALLRLSLSWVRCGSGEDPLLWATIRRAASLLRPEETNKLLAFMAGELPLSIHQVALQAVEETATVLDDALPGPVIEAVESLARRYIDLAKTDERGADVAAVAAVAVAAAVLARAPSASQLVQDAVQSCPARIRWLSGVILKRAIEHRARVRSGALEIPGVAEAVLALQGNDPPRGG